MRGIETGTEEERHVRGEKDVEERSKIEGEEDIERERDKRRWRGGREGHADVCQ